MKVLIIDGSVEVTKRLEEILSEAEVVMTIHKALSYNEAKTYLVNFRPEVVLLDMSLPGNNSFNLLKDIKSSGGNASVIVLSIHVDLRTKEQCKSFGVEYFFDKYNEFEKIPGAINEIAKRYQ
ncbi:MAG: response regulator [Chitinophagaceae bacterium]